MVGNSPGRQGGKPNGNWARQLGLPYITCILDRVARAKRRRSRKPGRYTKVSGSKDQRSHPAPRSGFRVAPPQILERIEYAKAAQEEAEAELAILVDQAVILGIGWPEIASRLGVTRQAARQHYQRRHRDRTTR
jgi:hypothetical protein